MRVIREKIVNEEAIQTTDFTSLQARLWTIAVPMSFNAGDEASRQWTATLVVARMFDVGKLL